MRAYRVEERIGAGGMPTVFRADGGSLAVGYDDGTTGVWRLTGA